MSSPQASGSGWQVASRVGVLVGVLQRDDLTIPIRTRADLLAEGWTDKAIMRAVRDGALTRVRHGAYVDGPTWEAMDEVARYLLRCRSVARQARTAVVLTHTSALPFFDAPMWGLDLSECHLTRRDHRVGRREAGVVQHSGLMLPGDVWELGEIAHSSPSRVAVEVTTVANAEAALAVVCYLLHAGLCTLDEVRERYDRSMTHWPHSLRTDLVLRLADERIESVGEARCWWTFWKQGLPKPIPQYPVYDDGMLIAELDFALPELGIWLEFDGMVKYTKHLRPGESAAEAVVREKRREDKVSELTGLRCLRITWADLADPVRLAARIRAFIEQVARARRH